ncbi:MAG: transglutaminase domain-containing protein [Candidatus Saccharibacteria bacterium]|nr:transglutaminase domain-containing protein [Candidatus Saccharibacteria bacterium]
MNTTTPRATKRIVSIAVILLLASLAGAGFYVHQSTSTRATTTTETAAPRTNSTANPAATDSAAPQQPASTTATDPAYSEPLGSGKGSVAMCETPTVHRSAPTILHTITVVPSDTSPHTKQPSTPTPQSPITPNVPTPQPPVAPNTPAPQPPATPNTPHNPKATPTFKEARYTIRHIDAATGTELLRTDKQGMDKENITVNAADLFSDGYELFDTPTKTITLSKDAPTEITFSYGKARELMSLTEFTRHPVNYDYPLVYRNLDFTGRQQDLEDFVVKKIYQGDKTTGVFYGTKDQADHVRKTLLNGSFQGAYARYATNMVPSLPKLVEGDTYEHSIDFTYQEHREDMILGEAKVTEFVNKYGNLPLSQAEKAKLIHDWLIKNPKVFNPPHTGQEWFYNSKKQRRVHFPASLLLDGEGVCLTYAMTFGRLAERMGLEVRLIQGYIGLGDANSAAKAQEMFNDPDSTNYHPRYLNHTWNAVKIDGEWYHVDTFQTIGFLPFTQHNPQPHLYFLQDEATMRESKIKMGRRNRLQEYTVHRSWSTNRIPAAPTPFDRAVTELPDRSEKDM